MAEAALKPSGCCAAEFLKAFVIGIAMVFRQISGALKTVYDMLRRWEVRVTDTETDDIDAAGCDLFFKPIQLCEQVRRKKSQSGCGLCLHLALETPIFLMIT